MISLIIYIVFKFFNRGDWSIILHDFFSFRIFFGGYVSYDSEMMADSKRKSRAIKSKLVDITIMIDFLFLDDLKS